MSNNSDFSDLGRDVGRAVRDAVEDFTHSRTFDEIKRSVDDIRRGVDDAIDKMNSPKPGSGPIPGPTPGPVEPPFQAAPIRQEPAAPQKREFNPNRKKEKPRFPAPSRAKSITFLVLGIVFGSIFSLLSVAFLLATMLGLRPWRSRPRFWCAGCGVRRGDHQRRGGMQLSQTVPRLLRMPWPRGFLHGGAAGCSGGPFEEKNAARFK